MMERLGPKGKAQAAGKKSGIGNALKLSDGASASSVFTILYSTLPRLSKIDPNDIDPEESGYQHGFVRIRCERGGKGCFWTSRNIGNFKFEPKKFATLDTKIYIKRLQGMNIVDFKKFSKSVTRLLPLREQ